MVRSFKGKEIMYSEILSGNTHKRIAPPVVDRKAIINIGVDVRFLSLFIDNGRWRRGPHRTDNLKRIE